MGTGLRATFGLYVKNSPVWKALLTIYCFVVGLSVGGNADSAVRQLRADLLQPILTPFFQVRVSAEALHLGSGICRVSRHVCVPSAWDTAYSSRSPPVPLTDIRAANSIIDNLLYISPKRHLLYATDTANYKNGIPSGKFEHLTCFLPGLLALGIHSLHEHLSLRERRTHMYAAEGLAQTCWMLYADAKTGLGPDEVVFSRWATTPADGGGTTEGGGSKPEREAGRWVNALTEWEKGVAKWRKGGIWGSHEQADKLPPGLRTVEPVPGRPEERDYWLRRPENLLRPEVGLGSLSKHVARSQSAHTTVQVVESLFLLWKTTGDSRWREKGWQICSAFDGHARTPIAYSTTHRVDQVPARFTDSMPRCVAGNLPLIDIPLPFVHSQLVSRRNAQVLFPPGFG